MIIPIKCFTCGKVLADKYLYYQEEVSRRKLISKTVIKEVQYLTKNNIKKTHEGDVLDELNLTRMCCRRHMLTHVDIG